MSWRHVRGTRKDGKGHYQWPGVHNGKYVLNFARRGDATRLRDRLALNPALNYAEVSTACPCVYEGVTFTDWFACVATATTAAAAAALCASPTAPRR